MIFFQLFDKLKQDNPENFKRIIPVKGDCSELGLGLSLDDRRLLVEEVTVVFHGAANVKFSDPLKNAVLLNTRGAREVMLLARSINNLKVTAILTMFSNADPSWSRFTVDRGESVTHFLFLQYFALQDDMYVYVCQGGVYVCVSVVLWGHDCE